MIHETATYGASLRMYTETAYHYTDAGGVYGILTGHQVWASAYTMLNDALEIRHGIGEVQAAAKTWVPKPPASVSAVHALRNYIAKLPEVFDSLPIYIVSASKSPTLVNQYQGYAGADGYAVGLAADARLRPLDVEEDPQIFGAGWLEVLYTATDKTTYAHSVFDELTASNSILGLSSAISGMMWMLEDYLAALVAVLKHESFIAEQEIRYIITYRGRPHFRPSARGIIPFLKLGNHSKPLTHKGDGEVLQVNDIYVGPPTATAGRRIRTLEQLTLKDYPRVEVIDSGVPYVP